MKISIITVSYNSAATIGETIESVLTQRYPNIEYIIIDGNSSDGTQEIVKSYQSKIDTFVCEKDNGLYDAMNKGIRIATGDIIGFLNSDDVYDNADSIARVMQSFEESGADCVFGDLYYFSSKRRDKPLRYYSGKSFTPQKVRMGILPPHPTFFVRACVYQKFGQFDTQFKYAADFDLMARFLYVHRISYHYLPEVLVNMRIGGVSTQGLKRVIEINKEDILSCKKNSIKTNFFLFHVKYFSKVLSIADPRYFF